MKVDRFLEFLRGGDKNKIQLSEVVVEALICLANELVLKLVSNAVKHRFQFSTDGVLEHSLFLTQNFKSLSFLDLSVYVI